MSDAEKRAREFLASGRFRKARDEFKQLCKEDRPRYLPLLVEANKGLAREMLSKGMVSEAQQVFAYLKTIAPQALISDLEVEFASRSGRFDLVAPAAAAALAGASAGLDDAHKRRLADELVLAFAPLPASGGVGSLPLIELSAVYQALEAVCAGRATEAVEALRPIPHGSVFSYWRMFIRGVAAFHSGQTSKARALFGSLPPGSAPAKAARAYAVLSDKPGSLMSQHKDGAALIDTTCKLVGLPGFGPVLAEAERLWRQGYHSASYLLVRKSVPAFPGDGLDWIGALTEFYFKALHTMSDHAADEFASFLSEFEQRNSFKSPIERMLVSKTLAHYYDSVNELCDFRLCWECFLRAHDSLRGHNPRLTSMAYQWLGEQLAIEREPDLQWDGPRPGMRDQKGAIEALEKAVTLDPDNLDAHLKLCAVYTRLDRISDRNRLLDRMTERFAENKAVLVRAGAGCLDRKAFVKGLGYLQRAFELDQLDPLVPDLLAVGRFMLAHQYFLQGRLDKGRAIIDEAAGLVVDTPVNFARGRWAHKVREGVLEDLHGDRRRGKSLLAEARAASPSVSAFLFFVFACRRHYDCGGLPSEQLLKEWSGVVQTEASAGRCEMLLRIFNYWRLAIDATDPQPEIALLTQFMETAATRPFTREEARQLIDQAALSGSKTVPVLQFVKGVLKQDPKDPLFRIMEIALGPFTLADPESRRGELQEILDEAGRRNDTMAAHFAQRLLAGLSQAVPPPHPFPAPTEPWEDERWMEDEPAEGDFDVPGDAQAGPLPNLEELRAVGELLAGMSPEDLRRARKTLPKGLPAGFVDALIEMARTQARVPPPPPASPRPKPPQRPSRRPEADDSQLELF